MDDETMHRTARPLLLDVSMTGASTPLPR